MSAAAEVALAILIGFGFGCQETLAEEPVYNGAFNGVNVLSKDQTEGQIVGLQKYIDSIDVLTAKGVVPCNCDVKSNKKMPDPDPDCDAYYRKMYAQPEVNMTVLMGESDLLPYHSASDPYRRYALIDVMQKDCKTSHQFLCGFTEEPHVVKKSEVIQAFEAKIPNIPADKKRLYSNEVIERLEYDMQPSILTKTITGLDGKPQKLHITVMNSSFSKDNDLNSNPDVFQGPQNQKSINAEDLLLNHICENNAFFYVGHARGGTMSGVWMEKGFVDNYKLDDEVHHTRQSFSEKIASCAATGPSMYYMGACNYKVFPKMFQKSAPDSRYMLTRSKGWPQDDILHLYGALNATLGMLCEPSFSQVVNPPGIDESGRMGDCRPMTTKNQCAYGKKTGNFCCT